MPDSPGGSNWSLADVETRFGTWVRAKVRQSFRADSEDVAQDVMLKLAQALPGLRDGRVEVVRAFVSRTVRSVCIDEWRRRAQRPPAEDVDAADVRDERVAAPGDAAIGGEARESVRRAVDALPERERTILRLRFVDGLGFREIGEVLGVPQGSVAGWYSRALAALRKEMT